MNNLSICSISVYFDCGFAVVVFVIILSMFWSKERDEGGRERSLPVIVFLTFELGMIPPKASTSLSMFHLPIATFKINK